MDARQRRVLFVVGIVLGTLVAGGVGALLATLPNAYDTSGTVTYQSNTGLNVSLTGSYNVSSDNPFPADDTVSLTTDSGNITLSASGDANATVSQITGTQTIVDGLDVTAASVTIDPEDKQQVTVGGDIETLRFRSISIDDGTQDFFYDGTGTTGAVTVHGLPANSVVAAVDQQSGTVLSKAEVGANGVGAFTGLPLSSHQVELQSSSTNAPTLSNPDPSGPQSELPSDLNVTVGDADFPADEVEVNISLDGSQVTSTNITSETRVTASVGSLTPGDHTWTVTATDKFGAVESEQYAFGLPSNATIYNESAPDQVIDNTEVNATVFSGGEEVFTRSTSDGNISLNGLPTMENLVFVLEADGYNQRTVAIRDITEQHRFYMLPSNASTVEVRFTLNDPTGTFTDDSTLYIRRPLNVSGSTTFETIASDEFGVKGVTATLEQDVRYRLEIQNTDNDLRVLGAYTTDVSETVTLQPAALALNYTDGQTYAWSFSRSNETGTPTLSFVYSDPANRTTNLDISIHERNNATNTLSGYPVEYAGPVGNVSISEPLQGSETGTTWVVEWSADRNDETIDARAIAGSGGTNLLVSLDPWWQQAFGFGILLITGGLFSRANVGVGAMTVALLGGVFWWIGWFSGTGAGAAIVLGIGVATLIWASNSSTP